MVKPVLDVLNLCVAAMAMPVVFGCRGALLAFACDEGKSWTMPTGALASSPQRLNLGKNSWRISCAREDCASEWRRESAELRVEMQELRVVLADAWMRDEMMFTELEKLVSVLVGLQTRSSEKVGNEEQSSVARDCESSVGDAVSGGIGVGLTEDVKPDLEELNHNQSILSGVRSEELQPQQGGLSTLRRLKTLNVHEYVHNALKASHLRSWLQSRGIAE
ncbi:uncharacterized protein [Physcomitrium patens]|uniref:Uncharacterized protein n=1 Tax=Physcomitrium patens TaxID=3218 RepID=A0A2K1JYN1_PHYPA|nr:uncharacterized protein LOC112287320 [Physcomitrium patens]XP_024385989.1 uncharacterized protein LOC112287320 [Physcomitrium patens]PNR46633.1 hypothetical protein PHYPA_013753 [Physcomitrium patens]|eukprot:XP_024385988.1 uncharacterized protein LOC112287320 [Physcomitrella patens]